MHPTEPAWQTPGYTPLPTPAKRRRSAAPRPERKPRRIFPWVFLAIQVLFLALIVSAAHSSHIQSVADCATQTALSAKDCQSASDAGTTIGVGVLVGFWVAFDVIVGGTYAIIRLARR
jgi:hypothetical protein